ncbi:MAG: hypothetical protein MJZ88_05135 [Paludibacteraceae bacterium]|nr:hypothetical protein [Paludibacteraceae bacterium]
MRQISFYSVPMEMEMSELMEALRDGRLYMQPDCVDADDTRAEVMNIVARIEDYAPVISLVEDVWQALLADDERLQSFRITQKRNVGKINRYRIAAIVHYMLQLGLYDMQICKSANLPCTFRSLCQCLFSDIDAAEVELYRRGCTNYARYEDELLIRKFCNYE